ncbi:deoxycytidyl transferase, partial [Nowakowskiella sp. JEL0078]
MAFKGFGDYLNQRHQKRLLQNYEFLTSSVKSSNTFSSISPSLRDIFETSAKRINDGYPLLFKDLLFWINGFTGSRINSLELRDLCALNGAMLAEYDSAKVTHILGTQLPDSKIQKLKKPMVHPDWILECVKQNKILSWSRYRIVPVTIQQSVSMFFDSGPFVIPKQNSDSTLNTGTENRKDKNKVYYSPELGKSNTSPATTCSLVDTRDEDDSASSPTPNEKRRRLEDSHQDIEIEDFFKPKEIVDDFNFEFQQDEEMDLYNHVHKDIFVNFENDNLIKNQYHSNETSTDSEEDSKALEWFGPQPDVNMTGAWVKRNISTAPGFLERYYESSRLHKLSTWKNELKDWVRQQYQQRQKLRPIHIKTNSSNHPRTVMHVDLDCFFASVSLLKHPEFQDCPVCVAHSAGVSGKSTSEIASCNYIARSFGIKNGMSIGKAIELCRDLKVVGYEFDMYVDASKKFFSVLLDFSDTIEVVSCDEAYIDVSSQVKSQVLTEVDLIFDDSQNPCQPPVCLELELAEKIRKRVFHDTGIHASIGISSNLLLARLATGKAKPNGAYFLDGEHETSRIMFLKDIPVRSVPGIGWVLGKKLEDKGTHTCGDLMKQSKTELIQIHGPKTGKMLFEYCRGIDARLLSKPEIRQSVGTDVNWGIRFEKEEQVFDFLKQLSEEVSKRLEKAELVGKMITVRAKKRKHKGESYKILGHGNCDNFSKSILLNKHTKDPDIIFRESLSIFKHFKIDADDLR